MSVIPKTGIKGLFENWQSDLLAAVSVSLVSLPLSLGIAYASEVPPISGVLAAIIGGFITTLFRGSHLGINGPTAGLIAVILSSLTLWQGDPNALNYVFAAIVVAGGLQVLLGILKLGKLAELFHSTIIHGILAAIGVIIFAKQIHITMGTTNAADGIIPTIIDAIIQIPKSNPFVVTISLAGLLLLLFHSKISFKLFHYVPVPMWILMLSLPFAYFFGFSEDHSINFFGNDYAVGPHLLVDVPKNILDAIMYPNFSQIGSWKFWSSVISITMISSIESLASSKAIDKLDPYKRTTDLDKDLIGVGLGTMVSGMIGGLPIVTVVLRSTVNIHNHAKTKWSNFYHGVFLLLFVVVLAPVITKVPLAALAILLVFTGYKLASPKVFKSVYNQGIEQLIFFIVTLILTLFQGLLVGIFGGLIVAFIVHLLLAKVTIKQFFEMTFKSGSNVFVKENGDYEMTIKGISNFMTAIKVNNLMAEIPQGANVTIDFSETRLVDFSIQEKIDSFKRVHANSGGKVTITGLDKHVSSTEHKLGLKLLTNTVHELTAREKETKEVAEKYDWNYDALPKNHIEYFSDFYFFKSRPIEFKTNCLWSEKEDCKWEITDIMFDEGVFEASEEYNCTLGLIRFPFEVPKFTIEQKGLLDKYIDISAHKDIDYQSYFKFSKDFSVKIEDETSFEKFMSEELKSFIIDNNIQHLESSGNAILLFPVNIRLAQTHEYSKIIKQMNELRRILEQ